MDVDSREIIKIKLCNLHVGFTCYDNLNIVIPSHTYTDSEPIICLLSLLFVFSILYHFQTQSVSSCSSNTSLSSARTQGSAPPNSSLVTKQKASVPAATYAGSGGVDETQFEEAFSDVPHINVSMRTFSLLYLLSHMHTDTHTK